jgi:hypothetical protein
MKWSDLPINPTTKVLRQFAAAWLVFFLALGGVQCWSKSRPQLGLALAIMAVVIGVAGLLRPALVRWIFVSWMVLAFPIGWLVSQVVLLLMYYGVLSPVAVFMRLRGRDVLNRKPAPERTTFWATKEAPHDVRSYFKQY